MLWSLAHWPAGLLSKTAGVSGKDENPKHLR
jgi:hypothetical protein